MFVCIGYKRKCTTVLLLCQQLAQSVYKTFLNESAEKYKWSSENYADNQQVYRSYVEYQREYGKEFVVTQLQQAKEPFLNFLEEIKAVMQALANDPIEVGSGIRQPRKRQHLLLHPEKTFPHPRVAITHPQRTYQDVKNEIASQLSNLPNFTAHTRITVEGQTVEHTITTFEPGQGIGKALQQRIADIQARNRDPRYGGYCRTRNEVEAEIIQRQFACIGAAPAQPQIPQSPRHARQVPVQGKCPKCGFSNNPPGSMFCNQCGTKL